MDQHISVRSCNRRVDHYWELRFKLQSLFLEMNIKRREKMYQFSRKGAVFAPLRYTSKFWNFFMKNSWCKCNIKQMNGSLFGELLNVAGSLCIASWEGANFVTEEQSLAVCINWLYSCNSDQTVVSKSFLPDRWELLPFLREQGCNNTCITWRLS